MGIISCAHEKKTINGSGIIHSKTLRVQCDLPNGNLRNSISYEFLLYMHYILSQFLYTQEHFFSTNTGAVSQSVLELSEACLRTITNTDVVLPNSVKRLSEGLKLKQQLGELLKSLEKNVSFIMIKIGEL